MSGRRSGFARSSRPDGTISGAPPRTFSKISLTAGQADVAKMRIVAAYSLRGMTEPPGPGCGSAAIAAVIAQINVRQATTSPRGGRPPAEPAGAAKGGLHPAEAVSAVIRHAAGEQPGHEIEFHGEPGSRLEVVSVEEPRC